MSERVMSAVEKMERVTIYVLLVSLLLVVVYSTGVFLVLLFGGILSSIGAPTPSSNILDHLHSIFSGFMLVLIGIELVHSIKMYIRDDVVHVEVVLLVALIGVSRHLIDMDIAHANAMNMIGAGVLTVSLSLGYFLIKQAHLRSPPPRHTVSKEKSDSDE